MSACKRPSSTWSRWLTMKPSPSNRDPWMFREACVRCLLLRVDPAQLPRLEAIHANLIDRLAEAKEQGWLGEVAAIETTMAAAAQKLKAVRAASKTPVHLG